MFRSEAKIALEWEQQQQLVLFFSGSRCSGHKKCIIFVPSKAGISIRVPPLCSISYSRWNSALLQCTKYAQKNWSPHAENFLTAAKLQKCSTCSIVSHLKGSTHQKWNQIWMKSSRFSALCRNFRFGPKKRILRWVVPQFRVAIQLF